jgi:hypothetical protein
MQRTFVALVGATVMSAAFLSAQTKSPSASSAAAPASGKEVTYIGCLEPGTGEGNFTLTNADEKGNKDKAAAHVTFKVVPSSDKVKLEDHLTQSVRVTGTFTDATKPATGESTAGEKLPTFTATKVQWERDYCGLPF